MRGGDLSRASASNLTLAASNCAMPPGKTSIDFETESDLLLLPPRPVLVPVLGLAETLTTVPLGSITRPLSLVSTALARLGLASPF